MNAPGLPLKSLVKQKPAYLHSWTQLSKPCVQPLITDALPASNQYLTLSACSWIIASSRLSSPRMCAWSSIPEMPRSHHHVLCEVCLVVVTQSHQTRKFLEKLYFPSLCPVQQKETTALRIPHLLLPVNHL